MTITSGDHEVRISDRLATAPVLPVLFPPGHRGSHSSQTPGLADEPLGSQRLL